MRVRDVMSGQDARSEDGVSLIEVLVAFSILGIVVAGLVATTINTLNLSRSNANRVVAANLASSEIQRIQALPFEDVEELVDAPVIAAPEVDGITFSVASDARWVSNDGLLGSCTPVADASAENILRVDVEVSWEPQRFAAPVRTQTSIAPPFEAYGEDGGSLAVFVSDDAIPPNPLPAATIRVTPVSTLDNDVVIGSVVHGVSDDSGCLVLSGLLGGDYRVEVELLGYVDAQTLESLSVQVGGVRVGFRSNLEFFLAPFGQLGATVDGREGTDGLAGALPAGLARFAVPADDPSSEPVPLPVDGTGVNVRVGSHELWAGFCPDADPGPGLRNEVVVAPGLAADGVAHIETVEVRWAVDAAPGNDVGGGGPLTLFAEHVGDCPEAPPGVDPGIDDFRRINLGAIARDEGAVRRVALPFGGPWRITAERTSGQAQVVGRAVEGDVLFDPSEPDTPTVLLAASTCTVSTPTWIATASQQLDTTAGGAVTAVTVTGALLAGDLLVVDVASEGGDAADWEPVGAWTAYPSVGTAGGSSSVTWVQVLEAGAASVSVNLSRPPSGDGGHQRGAVHVNVYRGAEPVASSNPVGGVGQLQQDRINLPGVQLRPGAVLHTTVLLEGSQPSGVTLQGGTAAGGPSAFQANPTDVNLQPPDLLFHTFFTTGNQNTNNQQLQWTGEADAREIRRLRFLGVCS